MLKLLIAEDEALERKALRFLLESFFAGSIEIVGEVTNGRDAVDKTILLKPQIVLMDIHMPIMEGLEACSIIKKNHVETEFIILTAFNYFDYAKQAINIGVSDYLLKPLSNDEFVNALNKAINKINSKNLMVNKNIELKENYKKIAPYVEKRMFENIAYGVTLTDTQFSEYRDIFGIESVRFCSMVFNLKDKQIFNDESIIAIKDGLSMLFSKIVGRLCLNDIILFVFDEDVGSKIISRSFEELLNNIRLDLTLSYKMNVSIGISSTNEGLNQLYISYKEAKRSCEREKNRECKSRNEDLSGRNKYKRIYN